MSVELRPFGVKCNIQCQYCYQNPQRDAGNVLQSYDIEVMKRAIEEEGGHFTMFGGEPLLMPKKDLEAMFAWGFQKNGGSGIQTNGSLIDDDHIRMFEQYRVGVGISVDGPGELNDTRWAGSIARTREATAATHLAISKLCRKNLNPSLITTLHKGNATRDKLPLMQSWLQYLKGEGVTAVRLHILEVEDPAVRQKYALSTEENLEALLWFMRLEKELEPLTFDVFEDMRNMLLGRDNKTTCVWNACDPYTTHAVRGVEGNGQRSNCGRTNKDGIDFVKASTEGFERYVALYLTPQRDGGCNGCRFFLMCKGQCPGTAIDGDWRNRTEHCGVWMALYRVLEEAMFEKGLEPLSARSIRPVVERLSVDAWSQGMNRGMADILAHLEQQSQSARNFPNGISHGDHTDA